MLVSSIFKKNKLAVSAARAFSSSANVVSIDFKSIQNNDKGLFDKFEEAYNDNGLGIMIIDNIPDYAEKRQRLLPLSQKLAHLSKEVLTTLETPEYFYGVGWSHGKEKFMGLPDTLKGSYYANPCFDAYASGQFDDSGNRIAFHNKWPKQDLPELQPAF